MLSSKGVQTRLLGLSLIAACLVSGCAERAAISGGQQAGAGRFRVWPGYDADVTLHPYTSEMRPCPEGALGTGCTNGAPRGKIIAPSYYEQVPFIE